ncbi:MAG: ABC transporter substrate-binding protein [Magnetococcales bacterium]|nr:NrtA/SsuA/CpmA family ABC transporter substrate-binding protein [Magnetococcales bacterium]NGZ28566.1 ABC transporter substrate-binding protein [Magnetococcales bacterium]
MKVAKSFWWMIWVWVALMPGKGFPAEAANALGIATQPMAVPIGPITAIMARDQRLLAQLREKGVEVKFTPFTKGSDINKAVLSGKADVAFVGDVPALEMVATGKIRLPAMVKMAFASVVARDVLKVEQLKGKRIANALNSSSHQILLAALHQVGLSQEDVTLVNMEVGEMEQALAEAKVDAFAAWEPTPSMALARHPHYFVVHRGLSFSFLYVTKALVERDADLYRLILASFLRAIYWLGESEDNVQQACQWNLVQAAQLSKEPMPVFLSQCVDITRRDLISPAPQGRIPPVLLTEEGPMAQKFLFLQHMGKIPKELPLQNLFDAFDTKTLESVAADDKGFGLREYHYSHAEPLPP